MYPIKKILVGLDLSEMDPTLIKFVSFIAKSAPIEDICFINVIRESRLPKELKAKFPELAGAAAVERTEKMQDLVRQHIDPKLRANFKFITKKGQAAKKILKVAREEVVDLVIVGRKRTLKGSGVLSQRLARRVECSLLIVPEDSDPKLEKILVPSDLTDYSTIAMEEAIAVASRHTPKAEVICQNVFTVPNGYYYTGKSYEEFGEIMKKHAQSNFEKFIRKIDTQGIQVKPIYSLDADDNPVDDIFQMAQKLEADILIMGAKGRTSTTALFLGSVAERIIQHDFRIPVLIVRYKGKNAGIIDYLKEI